jgi:hypothetical protein
MYRASIKRSDANKMLKKSLAYLLMSTQLILTMPAHADGNALIGILQGVLNAASKLPAGQNQNNQGNSYNQGLSSSNAYGVLAYGSQAKGLIGGDKHPLDAQQLMSAPGAEIFDPSNPETSKKMADKLNAITKQIASKKEISYPELLAYTTALMPYIRHLEGYAQVSSSASLVIPPGREAEFSLSALPVDSNLIGMRANNKVRLAPQSAAIQDDVRYIYEALAHLAATNPEYNPNTNFTVRGLMDTIVSMSAARMPYSPQLRMEERRVMDLALPNGAYKLQSWINTQAQLIDGFKRQGGQLPDYRPQRTNDPDSEFTMLAPGVAAKTENISHGADTFVHVRLANTTDQPFTFKPTDYVAIPSDGTSRQLLMGGLSGLQDGQDGCYGAKYQGAAKANAVLDGASKLLKGKTIAGIGAVGLPAALHVLGALKSPIVQNVLRVTPLLGNGMAAYELATGKDIIDGHELSGTEMALNIADLIPLEGALVRVGGNAFKFTKDMETNIHAGETVSFFNEFGNRLDSLAASPPSSFDVSTNASGVKTYRDSATGMTFDVGQGNQPIRVYRS